MPENLYFKIASKIILIFVYFFVVCIRCKSYYILKKSMFFICDLSKLFISKQNYY